MLRTSQWGHISDLAFAAIIRAHAHMQSAILIGCTCRWKCVQNLKFCVNIKWESGKNCNFSFCFLLPRSIAKPAANCIILSLRLAIDITSSSSSECAAHVICRCFILEIEINKDVMIKKMYKNSRSTCAGKVRENKFISITLSVSVWYYL